jgi:ABC-type sugar transport system substrate-binding protein
MAAKYPDIEVMEKVDNPASVEEATTKAASLISANPDLTGMAAFSSQTGPGMGVAIKEADKVGQIKLTSVDMEPQHLRLIRDGVASLLVGQKRKLFTYYGAQLLYDYANKSNSFSKDDAKANVSTVPVRVDTGLILITPDNIDMFVN